MSNYLNYHGIPEYNPNKIELFAQIGLMPRSLEYAGGSHSPFHRWDAIGEHVEISGHQRERLSKSAQRRFRRWSRRLNKQKANGTGWVMIRGNEPYEGTTELAGSHPTIQPMHGHYRLSHDLESRYGLRADNMTPKGEEFLNEICRKTFDLPNYHQESLYEVGNRRLSRRRARSQGPHLEPSALRQYSSPEGVSKAASPMSPPPRSRPFSRSERRFYLGSNPCTNGIHKQFKEEPPFFAESQPTGSRLPGRTPAESSPAASAYIMAPAAIPRDSEQPPSRRHRRYSRHFDEERSEFSSRNVDYARRNSFSKFDDQSAEPFRQLKSLEHPNGHPQSAVTEQPQLQNINPSFRAEHQKYLRDIFNSVPELKRESPLKNLNSGSAVFPVDAHTFFGGSREKLGISRSPVCSARSVVSEKPGAAVVPIQKSQVVGSPPQKVKKPNSENGEARIILKISQGQVKNVSERHRNESKSRRRSRKRGDKKRSRKSPKTHPSIILKISQGQVKSISSNGCLDTPKKVSDKKERSMVENRTPSSGNKITNIDDKSSSGKCESELTGKPQNLSSRSTPVKSDLKPKVLIKTGLRSAKKEPKSTRQPYATSRDKSVDSGKNKYVQKTIDAFFKCETPKEDPSYIPLVGPKIQESVGQNQGASSKGSGKSTTPRTVKNAGRDTETLLLETHVRRIYQDDNAKAAPPRVCLTPLPKEEIAKAFTRTSSKLGTAKAGLAASVSRAPRLAQVVPMPSSLKRSQESPTCPVPASKRLATSPSSKSPDSRISSPVKASLETTTPQKVGLEAIREQCTPVRRFSLADSKCRSSPAKVSKAASANTPVTSAKTVAVPSCDAGADSETGQHVPPSRPTTLTTPPRTPLRRFSAGSSSKKHRDPTETSNAGRTSPNKKGDVPRRRAEASSEAPLQLEEELAQALSEEAARAVEAAMAAQRNKKRHNRGQKVYAYCDTLDEHIERHPVQNEVTADKWSKWLNPTQLRCLALFMLENTMLCLEYSLEAERKANWEDLWVNLTRQLNTVCHNELTNLNTGLRMTVLEWKMMWLDLKSRMIKRVQAMKPKDRVHNLGSLECLLYNRDLYFRLQNSNGKCLGEDCPRIWCAGACVGVMPPAQSIHRRAYED